jgi:hypothetical protein
MIMIIDCKNLDICTDFNDGVTPPQNQLNAWGGVESLYLVVEAGKETRVITHNELWQMVEDGRVKKTMRQFYYGQ